MLLPELQKYLIEKIRQYVSENYQEYRYTGGMYSLAEPFTDAYDENLTISDIKAIKSRKNEPEKVLPVKLTFTQKVLQHVCCKI